jgi:hypothetical protein
MAGDCTLPRSSLRHNRWPLPALGADHTLQLSLDVTERQLQLIEERRTDGVQLTISLSAWL